MMGKKSGRKLAALLVVSLSGLLLTTLASPGASAQITSSAPVQPGQPCDNTGYRNCIPNYICKDSICQCAWGKLEVGFLDLGDIGISAGDSICDIVGSSAGEGISGLAGFIQAIIVGGMVLTVMAAMVSIVIGGYIYMTAGGNADRVRVAKYWAGSAILGIVLVLLAWLILYTISTNLV